MYFDHSDSSTKNLTLFIDDKRALNVLNAVLKQLLESSDSIRLKLTTHQSIVAKSLNYNSHNDLIHSLPVKTNVEDFVKSFVKQVNCTSSVKRHERFLERFIVTLQDAQLVRKVVNVHKFKSTESMPLYESMGDSEFNMPFPVCLFLDHETNELYIAKTDKQYSPPRVFYGIEETFRVAPEISAREINELLEGIRDKAEALLNESYVVWDGHNFRRESTDCGEEIRQSMISEIDNFCSIIG